MTTSPEIDEELSDLIKKRNGKGHGRCLVPGLLESLPPGSRAVVERAMADDMSPNNICDALRRRNLPSIGKDSIRKHMTGACSCQK